MTKEMIVGKIKSGTVIDHIPAGRALSVLKILGVERGFPAIVSIGMNVVSKRHGKKDIIKVEGRELKKEEVDKLALLAPHATVNIIRNAKVIGKREVLLPKVLEGVIPCRNPNCICNLKNDLGEGEPIVSRFSVLSEEPVRLRCLYCERTMNQEDIEKVL